jgi:nonribosomal peptide synthetase DhbF
MPITPRQESEKSPGINLLPLSAAQTDVWTAQQLAPESVLFNVGGYIEIFGVLEHGAFEAAVRQALSEMDTHHFRFVETSDGPRQYIGEAARFELPLVDVSKESDPVAVAMERMQAALDLPFNLATGPLYRYALIKVGEEITFGCGVWHHLIADPMGVSIFMRRVVDLYGMRLDGKEREHEAPVSWAEYLEDEASYRAGTQHHRDQVFWRERLQNHPQATTLSGKPPGWPGPTIESIGRIPADTVRQLEQLASAHGASLVAVILTVTAVYLSRMTAQRDVVMGMPVSARTSRKLRRVFGFLSNVVPLRTYVDPALSFSQLLEQTAVRVREAFRHQRYASGSLRRDLGLGPDQPNIYGTVLNFIPNDAEREISGRPVRMNAFAHSRRAEDLVITINARKDNSDIDVIFGAQRSHYVQSTLQRHRQRFVLLLESVVSHSESPVALLPLMDAAERTMILTQWSGADAKADAETLLHMFGAQVLRSPDAVAVASKSQRVSYSQLHARVHQVARHLIQRGVGSEIIVGLCVERSIEAIVGMLAIWQAGGVYLPLDMSQPEQRLKLILEDATPLLVLTGAAPAPGLPTEMEQLTVSSLESSAVVGGAAPRSSTEGPQMASRKLDLAAYIIYTSGSSGAPKGVVVTHTGIGAMAGAHIAQLRIASTSRVLQYASLNFDVSLAEIAMALGSGATLVLADPDALSGSSLRAQLVEQHITHLMLTPSVLKTVSRGHGLPLECLVVGGEACPSDLVSQWCRGLRMLNAYGPTETTVCASLSAPLADIAPLADSAPPVASVPIGFPIAGCRVYLLDSTLEPVPLGAPGEIYIAGAAVARGYLKRRGLTAERFVANPYGAPGSRMYRSGDIARWRGDGQLEFLGRADQQTKIRGFRVELEEIEAVLRAQPEVAQAAVAMREDAPGGRYLAAYLVLGEHSTLDQTILRLRLADLLPDHMIPAVFVTLAALPLTSSGKLDRRALPALAQGARSSREYQAAQTPTEKRLVSIWKEILQIETIGRLDEFFELGGHSLTALQVASRVRDEFAIELPLRVLFDARVLSSLASEVDLALLAQQHSPRLALPQKSATQGPAPLSYSQERMWLIQSLNSSTTAYNMACGVRMRGVLDLPAFSDSLNELIQRHEVLRSSIRLIDDQPRQVIEPWAGKAFALTDLRAEQDAESAALHHALSDTQTAFDLSRDSVLRVRLFHTGHESYLLIFVLHHIAGDQWSLGILGRELALLYNARRRGLAVHLDPLPITYRDYAIWQRSGVLDAQLERQLAFWHRKLENLPTADLPTDFVRPKVWTLSGTFYDRKIPLELLDRLEAFGLTGGSTLFMTVFAGFVALLSRRSGQKDIPVGVPVANRTHSTTEGLVGTFVNTVVLRNDLSGDPSFRQLLQRVRATSLEAFSNQNVSFDRLVQELGQRADRSRAPLAQVLFNVTNAPMGETRLDELTWEPVELDRGGAQFELSFSLDTEVGRKLIVEYNTDLFRRETIERLVGQYFTVLEAALAAPEAPISTLAILAPEEIATLRRWNATHRPYPEWQVFSRLFEAQAAATPLAVAVSCEDSSLTYAQLNGAANDLARVLRRCGAVHGSIIAVCTSRSPLMLIGLLAIQKAGAAYLPLDPAFPAERLEYMLADSGANLLVTSGELPVGLTLPAGIRVIDASCVSVPNSVSDNLEDAAAAAETAYLIYTSGSSGRPKGVAVPHRALLNFLCSMRERPGLQASDVVAAVTTISFDIAALELYLPLLVGARIELVSRQAAADARTLSRLLVSSGATFLQATPATWRMLLEADWVGGNDFRALCGGEPLQPRLADALLNRVGELWNMYGPTETTVWSTLDRVAGISSAISIGTPIANTQVHVLDAGGEMAPIGVAGEICIGGAGVAIGYHRRHALTAERFMPDRYSGIPGARLYRSGDMGRWGADGKLYHLGRLDTQVKIRGFRIELSEVEKTLGEHDAVRHAVVVVREAQLDDSRLVAYVVYRGEDLTTGDMKRYLRSRLPEYMVPSIVVPLASIPLLPNGKSNLAALPDPFATPMRAAADHDPPTGRTEQVIAEIWKSVLKVERIDAGDNFCDLGGYSLLSLRVAKLLEKRTGYRMDPRTLFFHNLRQVAALLESGSSSSQAGGT